LSNASLVPGTMVNQTRPDRQSRSSVPTRLHTCCRSPVRTFNYSVTGNVISSARGHLPTSWQGPPGSDQTTAPERAGPPDKTASHRAPPRKGALSAPNRLRATTSECPRPPRATPPLSEAHGLPHRLSPFVSCAPRGLTLDGAPLNAPPANGVEVKVVDSALVKSRIAGEKCPQSGLLTGSVAGAEPSARKFVAITRQCGVAALRATMPGTVPHSCFRLTSLPRLPRIALIWQLTGSCTSRLMTRRVRVDRRPRGPGIFRLSFDLTVIWNLMWTFIVGTCGQGHGKRPWSSPCEGSYNSHLLIQLDSLCRRARNRAYLGWACHVLQRWSLHEGHAASG